MAERSAVWAASKDGLGGRRSSLIRPVLSAAPKSSFVSQLLPWVRQRYHVTGAASQTIVDGSSLGGCAAAFAALCRPDPFGNVLAQSDAFHWRREGNSEYAWLPRRVRRWARLPLLGGHVAGRSARPDGSGVEAKLRLFAACGDARQSANTHGTRLVTAGSRVVRKEPTSRFHLAGGSAGTHLPNCELLQI